MTLQISLVSDISADLFTDLVNLLNVKINVIPPKKHHSSLLSDNPTRIEMIGLPQQVEECRVRVLVLLDEKVNKKKKQKKKKKKIKKNMIYKKTKKKFYVINPKKKLNDML